MVGLETYEDNLDGPIESTPPRIDVNPSNPVDCTRKSPTAIHAAHLSISPHSRFLIHDALRAQSDNSSWILVTESLTLFHRLRVLLPESYQHLVSRFFVKLLGCTLKTVDL